MLLHIFCIYLVTKMLAQRNDKSLIMNKFIVTELVVNCLMKLVCVLVRVSIAAKHHDQKVS